VSEESNVSCWVPAKLHYAKERSVVHGIKSILNVQVHQDHRVLGVALILEKTCILISNIVIGVVDWTIWMP
jgi:hypothetical protein